MSFGLWAALTLCLGSSANVPSSLLVTTTATATATATEKATIAAELPVATVPRLRNSRSPLARWSVSAPCSTLYALRSSVCGLPSTVFGTENANTSPNKVASERRQTAAKVPSAVCDSHWYWISMVLVLLLITTVLLLASSYTAKNVVRFDFIENPE